jgi:hypothetical protein
LCEQPADFISFTTVRVLADNTTHASEEAPFCAECFQRIAEFSRSSVGAILPPDTKS